MRRTRRFRSHSYELATGRDSPPSSGKCSRSLRLMPYDRLVVVAGPETFRSAAFRRLKGLEPGLRTIRVDPFDLTDALESIRGTIRRATGEGPVRISASGGTKILTNAAILA